MALRQPQYSDIRWVNDKIKDVKRYPLLSFFLITFFVSWSILLTEAAAEQGWLSNHLPPPLLLLAGFGPAIAAVLVSLVGGGTAGLKALLHRLLVFRVGAIWYLTAIFLPVGTLLAALGIHQALGGVVDWEALPIREMTPEGVNPFLLLLPLLLLQAFVLIGEELGWRGFALPRLQKKNNAIIASLILGLVWAVWHIPMAWAPAVGAGISQVPIFLFGLDILASTFIYTWLFNNTRGSLVLVLLMHAVNNTAVLFLPFFTTIQTDSRLFFITIGLHWITALVIVIAGGSYLARNFSPEEITA